ncbi:hypothetical protein G6F56_011240 [Rhizopus delemar]|nr:hypothetical protein G6F56_011240 [Rhizopus delemar]
MSVNTMNGQQRRHHQQQQQQQGNGEVELIQKNYRAALSELTFNSKPIITNLTIMAQENQTAATGIVREIENRLRMNTAGQKLPILYLIDSICKNVGGVYITIFGRNMVNAFLDAYTLSEPSAKERFERLLQTWKNGMPNGRPVFARHIIEPIEKSIAYLREKQADEQQNASNSIHVNPKFINKCIPCPAFSDCKTGKHIDLLHGKRSISIKINTPLSTAVYANIPNESIKHASFTTTSISRNQSC